jgi:hypothetical protein
MYFDEEAYADSSQSTDNNICVVDFDPIVSEKPYGYYEMPMWNKQIQEGNDGRSRISDIIGYTACWFYTIPDSGYYDIAISYPLRDTNAKTAKYTILKNYEVLDCFYQDQTSLPDTLNYYFDKNTVVKI